MYIYLYIYIKYIYIYIYIYIFKKVTQHGKQSKNAFRENKCIES